MGAFNDFNGKVSCLLLELRNAQDAYDSTTQAAHLQEDEVSHNILAIRESRKAVSEKTAILENCARNLLASCFPVAGAKVLGTTELLEKILLELQLPTQLTAELVCKDWHETIAGSRKIQEAMCLRALPRGLHFLSPFYQMDRTTGLGGYSSPGASFKPAHYYCCGTRRRYLSRLQRKHNEGDDTSAWDVTLSLTGMKAIPRAGDKILRMFVRQPPIKIMEVSMTCCGEQHFRQRTPPHESPPLVCKEGDEGLTIGDVFNAARRLTEEHRLCPMASSHQHDEQGLVHGQLTLSARANYEKDDPEVLKLDAAVARDKVAKRCTPSMLQYMNVKREAFHAGEKNPTLQEYESMQIALPDSNDDTH